MTERKIGHLLNVIQALLFHHNVPKHYWGEATVTTTFLINRLPSQIFGSYSPIQLLTKSFLDCLVSSTGLKPKVFECISFVHIPTIRRGKLDPRALKCIFLGYVSTQKGYQYYHPPTKKYYVSTDVTFVEDDS